MTFKSSKQRKAVMARIRNLPKQFEVKPVIVKKTRWIVVKKGKQVNILQEDFKTKQGAATAKADVIRGAKSRLKQGIDGRKV